MSSYYLDTSALVKRYFPETGSTWVTACTDPEAGNTLVISAITRVEAAAAFAIKHRSGNATLAERDAALRLLVLHTTTEYQAVSVEATLLDLALELTQRHRLRGYDAVQLATALLIHAQYLAANLPILTFVSADADLLVAAHAEGLATENPNTHP